ncbi:MAG: MaoC family dehydratase [Pseudomonadota bacterium]
MNTSATAKPLFLDDLSVSDVFRSGTYCLDEQQITAFAAQFDPQPFHLDGEAAKGTLFRGLAASGWHTAAITMRLLVESVPFGNGLIGAGSELSWPAPTRPGDELRIETEVLAIAPSSSNPDKAIVSLQTLTLNQHGQTVQRLIGKLVVFRRPADGASRD